MSAFYSGLDPDRMPLSRDVGRDIGRDVGRDVGRSVGLGALRVRRRGGAASYPAVIVRGRRATPVRVRRRPFSAAQIRGLANFEPGVEQPIQMGSWFSKAFKSVTGTKLSQALPAIVGTAANLIAPGAGSVIGAAAGALLKQGVPGYAGGSYAPSAGPPAFPPGGATGAGMGPAQQSSAMYSGGSGGGSNQAARSSGSGDGSSMLPLALLGAALLLGGRR